MKSNHFKKVIFVGILFLSLLNVFSQDTLTYKYVFKTLENIHSSYNIKQYFVKDSIFAIDRILNGNKPHYFKVKNGKWFMKYNSNWKVFFNKNKNKCGSWKIGKWDFIVQWQKTDIIDDTDTVYMFDFLPLNAMIQDGVNPYYFTYSSGIIAFWIGGSGFYVREDKMYLYDILKEEIYQRGGSVPHGAK